MRPEPFKKWTRPPRLQLRLGKLLPKGMRLRLKLHTPLQRWDFVELHRDKRHLTVTLATRGIIANDGAHFWYRCRLPVAIYLFSRSSASMAATIVELHDGSYVESDHMVFSANFPNAFLIPDPEFFNSKGYASHRLRLADQRRWHERADLIVWRGATSGEGLLPHQSPDLLGRDMLQRIRFCALLKTAPGIDAKIYWVTSSNPVDKEILIRAGLYGSTEPEHIWLDHKFAFDIDGHTNAWSNFFIRLLFGCCVLKVASPAGFRQWYYDRLRPWVHYVPIDASLDNLNERIHWCRSHPAECAAIAASGQALALTMTFEAEMRSAIQRINQRLGNTAGNEGGRVGFV